MNAKTLVLLGASALCAAILPGKGWTQEVLAPASSLAGKGEAADPDLHSSGMHCPPPRSIAGKPLVHEITIKNTGAVSPDKLSVSMDLPANMMFAGGSPGVTISAEQRSILWEGRLTPGEEMKIAWAIIASPDSDGNWANTRTIIQWDNWSEADGFWHQHSTERLCESELVDRGPGLDLSVVLRFLLAHLALLLLVMATMFLLIRRGEAQRSKESSAMAAPETKTSRRIDNIWIAALSFGLVASLLIANIFAAMVLLPNVRAFTAYREASCTVLDRNLFTRQSQSTGSGGKRSSYLTPMYSVRYRADGLEQVAMGSGVWGGMDTTSESRAADALAAYKPGVAYTCWYDPDDHRVFLFTRRPGVFSLMFVFPLILMWLTGHALKKMIQGRW